MDPFALPCHPDRAVTAEDRDWRAIGVKSADDVRRKTTRCPDCKTDWTAFLRAFGGAQTVEWLRPVPFLVTAAPVDGGPLWQDATEGHWSPTVVQDRAEVRRSLQEQVAGRATWQRSSQLVVPVYALTSGGEVVAEPGELLLERREKWNAQDRRLALLWSARRQREVVAWHGFARLLQDA